MTLIGKTPKSPLDPQIADTLLDRLGSDDDYRELFQRDPAQALAQIGYQPPMFGDLGTQAVGFSVQDQEMNASVAGCLQVSGLASKETIQGSRAELRSMLTSAIAHNPPNLDVGFASVLSTRGPTLG